MFYINEFVSSQRSVRICKLVASLLHARILFQDHMSHLPRGQPFRNTDWQFNTQIDMHEVKHGPFSWASRPDACTLHSRLAKATGSECCCHHQSLLRKAINRHASDSIPHLVRSDVVRKVIDVREHPRRRHETALVAMRIAIIVISIKLNIDHFNGALLPLRQTPSAGRWRKPAKSLEGFFVDQYAEPVARALLPPIHPLALGPRRELLAHGVWGCAFQAAVFDDHVLVSFPDFASRSVIHIFGAGVGVCLVDLFETFRLNPLVDDIESSCKFCV